MNRYDGPGRPDKLNDELIEKLCKYIKAGNYLKTACRCCGIAYSTFRNWILKAEEIERQYGDFDDVPEYHSIYIKLLKSVRKAESQCETRAVALWNKAFSKDWRSIRDFLERRFSDRWGRKDRHDHSGDKENPIQHEMMIKEMVEFLKEMTDDEIKDMLATIEPEEEDSEG